MIAPPHQGKKLVTFNDEPKWVTYNKEAPTAKLRVTKKKVRERKADREIANMIERDERGVRTRYALRKAPRPTTHFTLASLPFLATEPVSEEDYDVANMSNVVTLLL